MQRLDSAKIDMFERLPVPFGLVRYGVAPDHPEVKNCQDRFEEVAASPNFTFVGNVHVGEDVTLSTLKEHYDAVLFAYGASYDRTLGVPGEHLEGIHSARTFVGWYNGLPEFSSLQPRLTDGDTAVVIGNGNVALDVARILLSDVDALRKTDIAEHAVEALLQSKIRRVVVAGRRGPMQAAFTIKELRELLTLRDVGFTLEQPELVPDTAYIQQLPRLEQRKYRFAELLRKGAAAPSAQAARSWNLLSLASPQAFHEAGSGSGKVGSMAYEINHFRDPASRFGKTAGVCSSGETSSMECSAVFRSIGYKSETLPGLEEETGVAFDPKRGVIANDGNGRALSVEGAVTPGWYCTGWVQTGPTGVIASTMENAFSVAEVIAEDWSAGKPFLTGGGRDGWSGLRKAGGLDKATSWDQWKAIDAAERQRGQKQGKEREKFTQVRDMLQVAFAG